VSRKYATGTPPAAPLEQLVDQVLEELEQPQVSGTPTGDEVVLERELVDVATSAWWWWRVLR